MDGEAWRAALYGVVKSQTELSDWTELTDIIIFINLKCFCPEGGTYYKND